MIEVKRYNESFFQEWNKFNKESKKSIFMFDRKYMDYHRDRFVDYSLLFYEKGELLAILPMNISCDTAISHGGLTYGGFVTNDRMKQVKMDECVLALKQYLSSDGIRRLIYKETPSIYERQKAEEDRYSLFHQGARLLCVEPSTTLNLPNPIHMSKGRKAQISRARREGIGIKRLYEFEDYKDFMKLENQVLQERHQTVATHTPDELFLLHNNFPNSIHLYGAFLADKLVAGCVLYEYSNVIHTQYMGTSVDGRRIGALDLLIDLICKEYCSSKQWLDFGISSEEKGKVLNEGLIFQKESFGGRTITYNTWEMIIK